MSEFEINASHKQQKAKGHRECNHGFVIWICKVNPFLCYRQGQLCIRCLRGVERGDDMSSMLDGDDDDRSAISSLILPPSGQLSPREDLVTNKLVKFDVSY